MVAACLGTIWPCQSKGGTSEVQSNLRMSMVSCVGGVSSTCPSYRGILPEVCTALQDAIGREEDQQTIGYHPCKVDDSIPQVFLVLAAVPILVAAVQGGTLWSHRHNPYPHLVHPDINPRPLQNCDMLL